MTQTRGEVYDIGYQRYTGPRQGRGRARMALWVNGVRTALGLGRGWPSKVLPVILFLLLMGIAIIFTLLGTTIGSVASDVPGHAEYYQGAIIAIVIFSALIAPELLCADRRNGVIHLYLTRPLTTTDYVLGRWLAFFSVTLVFVYLPQITMFVGLTLGAAEPLDYLRDNWLDAPRFLTSGLVLALFTTTLPLAVAAFTTRRAYAAVFTIGLLIVSTATGSALAEQIAGDSGKWFVLIDIAGVPIALNHMLFNSADSAGSDQVRLALEQLQPVLVIWYLIITAGPGFILWWKYRNLKA